jgi:mono/diheme cytochrome c family protein
MPRLISALLFVPFVNSGLSIIQADDGADFFDKKIRPVLVDHCYECHSAESDEPGGGLLVDTRSGLRKGGETGPAVVPKDLKNSLMLSAIEYRDLEMPPSQKLDDEIIANVRKWIKMGAPDPRK